MASSGSTRSSGRVGSLISAARESFSDEFDALAFAVHASFLAKGYKCVKLAETDQETDLGDCPTGWNASKEGYSFCYSLKTTPKPPAPKSVVLKMIRMETNLLLYASSTTTESTSEPRLVHLEMRPGDHVRVFAKGKGEEKEKDLFLDLGRTVGDVEERFINTLISPSSKRPISRNEANSTATASDAKDSKQKSKPKPTPQPGKTPAPNPHPLADPRRPHRPVPGPFPSNPRGMPRPGFGPANPGFNPFAPGNTLIGPRNPGFGPGRMPGGLRRPRPGRLPGARFDPFGPLGPRGIGDPDPDHFRIPGRRDHDEDDII